MEAFVRGLDRLWNLCVKVWMIIIWCWPATFAGQVPAAVQKMAENERNARLEKIRFSYEVYEKSTRTGGHLWHEFVVETDDGPLKQLLAVDGQNLTVQQAQAERDRLGALIAKPSALRDERTANEADEGRLLMLLQSIPKAFLLTPAGQEEGCTKYQFRPNPAFQPSSMEEHALQSLSGNVSIAEPAYRLCRLDAILDKPVDFGFRLLGHLDENGSFLIERKCVEASYWKSNRIDVHLRGKVLLLKTLSKDQSVVRRNIRLLPAHLSLQQSAALLR